MDHLVRMSSLIIFTLSLLQIPVLGIEVQKPSLTCQQCEGNTGACYIPPTTTVRTIEGTTVVHSTDRPNEEEAGNPLNSTAILQQGIQRNLNNSLRGPIPGIERCLSGSCFSMFHNKTNRVDKGCKTDAEYRWGCEAQKDGVLCFCHKDDCNLSNRYEDYTSGTSVQKPTWFLTFPAMTCFLLFRIQDFKYGSL